MSDEFDVNALSDELISVPAFLATNANDGISTVASCYNNQIGDCGTCQGDIQSCSSSQYGDCNVCEGYGGQSCFQDCSQSGGGGCAGEGGDDGPCLCTGGQGQYSCGEACGESTPDPCWSSCMDCENSCQNTVQYYIDLWDWFATTERQKAYNAIVNKGLVSDFSKNVWNDLVDKVYDVRGTVGLSPRWSEGFDNYYNTRMSAADKTLTAKRFNSLLHNINLMKQTGITARSTGDEVLGSYFLTMTNALNAYIGSL